MSFSKHKNMEYPTQAHLAKEPRSFNNFSSPNRTLPTLDIEAARASERARDQKTWTASQWSDDSWDDTAVEGRSNSFDGHSRISKDGKSITGSISEFYMDGATGSSQSVSRDEKLPSTSGTPVAEAPLSLSHQIALISICCLAQFLNLAGMNQTVAPVMILSDYFDIRDYGTLSWFSAAYSMSVGTFILPAGEKASVHSRCRWLTCSGRLGDMYGHKRIFVLGWIWFAISSFVCGFSYVSGDIVLFSIFRAFQGIGPAVLVPNAIALLARNFALGTPRNMAFAWFGAAGPTGATAGAVFTALVAQLSWWPWCFWALAGVCLIVATLSLFVIPGKPGDLFKSPPSSNNLTFDYWGCLTGVSGLILVNFALNQAPLVGWFTWYIPSLLILGAALLWTFVMIELHHTKDPLIPIRGLGRDAYFALGCIAAGWGSHGIWAYFLYLFVSDGLCCGSTVLLNLYSLNRFEDIAHC
jgi:MFS family permease